MPTSTRFTASPLLWCRPRRWSWLFLASLLLVESMAAYSPGVVALFKGQILVCTDIPEATGSDKEVVARLKKHQRSELVGERGDDDQTHWTLKLIMFPNHATEEELKLVFLESGKFFAGSWSLRNSATRGTCIVYELTIAEEEGVKVGHSYDIKLVDSRERAFATVRLTLK